MAAAVAERGGAGTAAAAASASGSARTSTAAQRRSQRQRAAFEKGRQDLVRAAMERMNTEVEKQVRKCNNLVAALSHPANTTKSVANLRARLMLWDQLLAAAMHTLQHMMSPDILPTVRMDAVNNFVLEHVMKCAEAETATDGLIRSIDDFGNLPLDGTATSATSASAGSPTCAIAN